LVLQSFRTPTISASGAAVARVAKRDAQQVVRGARREVTLDDFEVTALVLLESVERRASLLLERHGNERRARKSCDVGIEWHNVAGDETALLEQADPIAIVDFVYTHNSSRFAEMIAYHAKSSLRRPDFGYTFRGFGPTLPHQCKEMVRCSSECHGKSRTTNFASG
jgi:hypothetical protein